jgi:hypothetical protein
MTVVEAGLTHIDASLSMVLKEVRRRAELRPRLEAEFGRALSDDEFLVIAERTGINI